MEKILSQVVLVKDKCGKLLREVKDFPLKIRRMVL